MNYKKLGLSCVVLIAASYVLITYLATPRIYDTQNHAHSTESRTNQTPLVQRDDASVLPDNSRFYTLHSDNHNSDRVTRKLASELEMVWNVDSSLFIVEGPTQDINGDLYISPVWSPGNEALISLDSETGERRWFIEYDSEVISSGGGAPLILNDPDRPGKQTIYLGLSDVAYAVTQEGELLWEVETGLERNDLKVGDRDETHVFGFNYHPRLDAIIGVNAAGNMYVLDRKSGKKLLPEPFSVPGETAKSNVPERPPEWLVKRVDKALSEVFGNPSTDEGRFSVVINALFGGGHKVSNFYAIDEHTGRMFLAATAPDEADGNLDGASDFGALYAIDFTKDSEGQVTASIAARRDFQGGSGATPSLSPDGALVYTADNDSNVLAFNRDLEPQWSVKVGENIPGSISVGFENDLYAVSFKSIYKIVHNGNHADIAWMADLDMYPEFGPYQNINMTTATVAENGISVAVGSGLVSNNLVLPLKMGVGLLDRDTGKVLQYTEGLEESISITMLEENGGIYLAHSPIRRAVSKALFGPLVRDLTGGVSYFKPVLAHDSDAAAND